MKPYYLETNSITSLSLEMLARTSKHCFTSYLAILEIISGITEKNYSRKRSILQKIIESKVSIDWKMPQQVLALSYKINYTFDARTKPFINTMKLILEKDTYQEAYDCSMKNKRYWTLRSLQKADMQVAYPNIETNIRQQKAVKSKLTKSQIMELENVFRKAKTELSASELSNLLYLLKNVRDMEIKANAMQFLAQLHGNISDAVTIELLLKNYEGSQDIYFFSFAYRLLKNSVLCTTPAINDFYDTSHLLYVNRNTKIVTDDIKLKNDMGFLYPNNVLSCNEYININNIPNA